MTGSVKPGQYEIKTLSLTGHNGFTINLQQSMSSLEIYEDIYSNNISARLGIQSSEDLVESIPIIGQETVKIKIDHPGGRYEIDLDMVVHRISGYERENMSSKFVLELVSEDTIKNLEKRVSEYMEGSATKIAKKLFDQIGAKKQLKIKKESDDDLKLIIPNYTPFRGINWMCEKAFSGKEANYMFFANKDSFVMTPLSKLFEEEHKIEFTAGVSNYGNNPNYEDKMIKQYQIVSSFDVIGHMNSGMYKTTALTVDLLKRTVKKLDYDIYSKYRDIKHVASQPLYDLDGQGRKFNPTNHYVIPENKLEKTWDHDKTFLSRKAQLQYIDNMKVNVTVYGDTALHAGDCVKLNFPIINASAGGEFNKIMSGKWLVSSIKHRFESKDYYIDMECVRDGLDKKIPAEQPTLKSGVK